VHAHRYRIERDQARAGYWQARKPAANERLDSQWQVVVAALAAK
jgi:hypothetical protein